MPYYQTGAGFDGAVVFDSNVQHVDLPRNCSRSPDPSRGPVHISVILQEGGKSISRPYPWVSMGIHHLMTISTGLVVDLYIDLSLITTNM